MNNELRLLCFILFVVLVVVVVEEVMVFGAKNCFFLFLFLESYIS